MTSSKDCDVAIIGAGPYGLSSAAHLKALGMEVRVFGEPMQFWADGTPPGMLLRSPREASTISDPYSSLTLEEYEKACGIKPVKRLPKDTFVNYGKWFQTQLGEVVDRRNVSRLFPGKRRIQASSEGRRSSHEQASGRGRGNRKIQERSKRVCGVPRRASLSLLRWTPVFRNGQASSSYRRGAERHRMRRITRRGRLLGGTDCQDPRASLDRHAPKIASIWARSRRCSIRSTILGQSGSHAWWPIPICCITFRCGPGIESENGQSGRQVHRGSSPGFRA